MLVVRRNVDPGFGRRYGTVVEVGWATVTYSPASLTAFVGATGVLESKVVALDST